MESFAGADLHKRVTQLAVLRDGQSPSQFRFSNDPKTVHGVLKKLPTGTKIAVEATGSWWWFVEKQGNWDRGQETLGKQPSTAKFFARRQLQVVEELHWPLVRSDEALLIFVYIKPS
jgi:hypothetical protein